MKLQVYLDKYLYWVYNVNQCVRNLRSCEGTLLAYA